MQPVAKANNGAPCAEPPIKRQRFESSGSNLLHMQQPVSSPRLNFITADYGLNLPATLYLCQQDFFNRSEARHESGQSDDQQTVTLSVNDLTSELVVDFHRQSCAMLYELIPKDDAPQERHISVDRVSAESPFAHYAEQLSWHASSDFRNKMKMKCILTNTREIAILAQRLSLEQKHSVLSRLPTDANQIQCLDGMLDRLESSLAYVKSLVFGNHSSLTQLIDGTSITKTHLLFEFLKHTVAQANITRWLPPEFHVHAPNGVLMCLGVNQSLIGEVDTFAHMTTRMLDPDLRLKFLKLYESNIQQRFKNVVEAPSASALLRGFEQGLQSLLDVPESDQVSKGFIETLNSLSLDPLAQMLVRSSVQLAGSLKVGTSQPAFHQCFGVWDDDVMVLKDWDWQKINQCLNHTIASEWCMAPASSRDSEWRQHLLTGATSTADLMYVGESLMGAHGDVNQCYALQFIADHAQSIAHSETSAKIRETVLSVFFLSPLISNELAQGRHLNDLWSQLPLTFSTSPSAVINQQLWQRTVPEFIKGFDELSSYVGDRIIALRHAIQGLVDGSLSSVEHACLLVDLVDDWSLKPMHDLLHDCIRSTSESVQTKTKALAKMIRFVKDSDQRIHDSFISLCEEVDKIRFPLLRDAVWTSFQEVYMGSTVNVISYLSSPIFQWFPKLLEDNNVPNDQFLSLERWCTELVRGEDPRTVWHALSEADLALITMNEKVLGIFQRYAEHHGLSTEDRFVQYALDSSYSAYANDLGFNPELPTVIESAFRDRNIDRIGQIIARMEPADVPALVQAFADFFNGSFYHQAGADFIHQASRQISLEINGTFQDLIKPVLQELMVRSMSVPLDLRNYYLLALARVLPQKTLEVYAPLIRAFSSPDDVESGILAQLNLLIYEAGEHTGTEGFPFFRSGARPQGLWLDLIKLFGAKDMPGSSADRIAAPLQECIAFAMSVADQQLRMTLSQYSSACVDINELEDGGFPDQLDRFLCRLDRPVFETFETLIRAMLRPVESNTGLVRSEFSNLDDELQHILHRHFHL